MKHIFGSLVGVYVLFLFFLVPRAEAINIAEAEITGGAVVVVGNQAAKLATITWEGTPVTQSNKGGAFKFATTDLPLDCVGELSDGVDTIDVVVDGCTTQQVVGGGVLKTGQTTCYDSAGNVIACTGTGQDGELQKGAARSYTDNLDGTITDNATGLMWEKLTNPGDGSIHDYLNAYTWANAFQKIADLNTANFAGHNDWRLPNINELQTLADYGRFFKAIDPAFNSGDSFTESTYWSSTTGAWAPPFAWFMDFNVGFVSVTFKTNDFFVGVRAVRGGS